MTNPGDVMVSEFAVRARFDDVCRQMRECSDRLLDKPVGYWALVSDRRLPYALLDRTLRDVTARTFLELAKTPGIGKQKMASLVMLLERAQRYPPLIAMPSESASERFVFEDITEATWQAWRQTIRTHGLENEPLGRLAPSLQQLPSVIWHVPLSTYLDSSLADLRSLKTHGEKRIRGIIEVFFHLHQILHGRNTVRHLVAPPRLAVVTAIEAWLGEALVRNQPPDMQDFRQQLLLPLLNQLSTDGGETVSQLVTGRLGIEAERETVIQQAERLQITRARVYQLIDVAAEIAAVRWPAGKWQLAALQQLLPPNCLTDLRHEWLLILRTLLFPERARSDSTAALPLHKDLAAAAG